MATHKVITQVRNPILPTLSQSPGASLQPSLPGPSRTVTVLMIPELLWVWGTGMKTNTETTNRSKIIRAIFLFLDGDMLSLLQGRCTHLSDWHGAENVEEDEGAVSVILTQQVAVGETLDVWEGDERKLCHHSAIKSGKESTGSPLETAEELLDTERTSEHLQQATRAGKKARPHARLKGLLPSPAPLHTLHQGGWRHLSLQALHMAGFPQEQFYYNQSVS